MNETSESNIEPTDPRPIGFFCPGCEHAQQALAALEARRVADAVTHINKAREFDTLDRVWKTLLRALVAAETTRLSDAEQLLLQSAALAWIASLGDDAATKRDGLRLGARILHHLGWVYRRQDRPDHARNTHQAAYRLREQYGSYEELWATATELGLDAVVAARLEEGRRWHLAAIDMACKASEEPLKKQAVGWTNLSRLLSGADRHEEAVEAARTARRLWREHDIAAITAAQADAKLGSVLLEHGRVLCERNDRRATDVLKEAVECLATSRDGLQAFGVVAASDVQSCADQVDFANRLRDSLPP